jgi:hypothetical protein
MAFLMRHDRAHLAITEKDPETLITPEEEEELPQEDQTKMRKTSQKWKNRNETTCWRYAMLTKEQVQLADCMRVNKLQL